jgi:hypothetical protein
VIVDGIADALLDVDAAEAGNFFENCGYRVP